MTPISGESPPLFTAKTHLLTEVFYFSAYIVWQYFLF